MAVTVCLSHKEDVDGIASAVLINSAFKNVRTILADYANIIYKLDKLANELEKVTKGFNRIFICDLGLNKKNHQKFVYTLNKFISLGYKVTYIDHHDIDENVKRELKNIGVNLIHTTQESTSIQVYHRYKKKLKQHAAFFAAAGALTDYLETQPIASTIISRYDRQFLMLESTALSYMISSHQNDDEYLQKIVKILSEMKFPHDIEGGFIQAEKYAIKISHALTFLSNEIVIGRNLAFVENNLDLASSTVVNFILGISEKKVAMVYKFKEEKSSFIISIRGSKNCDIHLGRVVNEIASRLGGSGGGHDKACGAVIPKEKFDFFVTSLEEKI